MEIRSKTPFGVYSCLISVFENNYMSGHHLKWTLGGSVSEPRVELPAKAKLGDL